MRTRLAVALFLFLLAVTSSSAQRGSEGSSSTGEEFVGVWSGKWEGAGASGGFELTLEKIKDGVAGKVSVTGEPTYQAAFKKLSFDGKKMSAAYDFPPNEEGEVVLAVTFDGKKASGSWTLRAKAGGDFASGTVDVTRQ